MEGWGKYSSGQWITAPAGSGVWSLEVILNPDNSSRNGATASHTALDLWQGFGARVAFFLQEADLYYINSDIITEWREV